MATSKWNFNELERGDVVIAAKHLDPEGANVRPGTWGVVFEEAGAYAMPSSGPMVRWANMGICNIYDGDILDAKNIGEGC
jgi:hypothetical protein